MPLGIEPNTVYLPTALKDPKATFVDVVPLWADNSGRYLHAKAILLEGFKTKEFPSAEVRTPLGLDGELIRELTTPKE